MITGKFFMDIAADLIQILYSIQAKEQNLQFSKAPIMSNFGELPFGEIPEPLKYVRPFRKPQPILLFFLFIINRNDYSFKWYQSLH